MTTFNGVIPISVLCKKNQQDRESFKKKNKNLFFPHVCEKCRLIKPTTVKYAPPSSRKRMLLTFLLDGIRFKIQTTLVGVMRAASDPLCDSGERKDCAVVIDRITA